MIVFLFLSICRPLRFLKVALHQTLFSCSILHEEIIPRSYLLQSVEHFIVSKLVKDELGIDYS